MPAPAVFMVKVMRRKGFEFWFLQQRAQFFQRPPAENQPKLAYQRVTSLLQPEAAHMQLAGREL